MTQADNDHESLDLNTLSNALMSGTMAADGPNRKVDRAAFRNRKVDRAAFRKLQIAFGVLLVMLIISCGEKKF